MQSNEHMLSREARNLARRLLDCEEATEETSELAVPAVVRLSEKLRGHLCTLAGIDTYRLLVSRALTLARPEAPSLDKVQVTAEGSVEGLGELASPDEKDDAGVVFIAQLLELFLDFIGVPLMVHLLQDVSPHLEVTSESGNPAPFENILQEVSQLTNVSKRLESLADQHPSVEEALLSISGNVRSTATLLEVLALIKNKKNNLPEDAPQPPSKRYLM